MLKLAVRALCLVVPAVVLWAGSVWEMTDFRAWSAAQVEQMLHESPWAQAATVDAGGSGGQGGRTGGIGFPTGGGRSGGGVRLPGGGWGGGLPFPVFVARYNEYDSSAADSVVRWESALPVRQALARIDDGLTPAREDELLHHEPRYYVIAMSSLPLAGAWLAAEPERLRQSSRLVRKGKPPIRAEKIETVPRPGAPGIVLYFPRDVPITIEDKTVVFEMTPGEVNAQAKFRVKDMVYRGRLEM